MRGDPTVIAYLNKALRSELTAINQYWLHYRLLENWGYRDLAKKWRKESIEEMQHADKVVRRILFLDGFPNKQVLDPLRIGQNVREALDCDLATEMSARALYEEAATYCHGAKDYVTRALFEDLMKDEEKHIDFLETQLTLVTHCGSRTWWPRGGTFCPVSVRRRRVPFCQLGAWSQPGGSWMPLQRCRTAIKFSALNLSPPIVVNVRHPTYSSYGKQCLSQSCP
jgi:bacterioferritin